MQEKPSDAKTQDAAELDPKMAALIRAIRERSKVDPRVGAKLGGKEVFQRLIRGMKDEKGVHVESLLCALGALAGYSCQASLRAQAAAKGLPETAWLTTVATRDGREYFFGDPMNRALATDQYSLWSLAGGAAQYAGAKALPDLKEIIAHTASAVGDAAFGIPRLPAGHAVGDIPINYLKGIWPLLLPTVKLFCPNPVEWPVLFACAAHEAIETAKGAIDPALAVKIVMESAVPMSKVDLANC